MSGTAPGELWQQASGDRDKYRELMIKHGHIVKCECPCHSAGRGHCEECKPRLPCGWEPGRS